LRNVEIPLPFGIDCLEVERAIDKALAQVGLQISLRDTLKKFPDCVHWHAKNGRGVGTLEITLGHKSKELGSLCKMDENPIGLAIK
jgi:hypothetical protein